MLRHVLTVILIAGALFVPLSAGFLLVSTPEKEPPACTVAFFEEETLANPSWDGITIQLIPAERVDAYVEFRRSGTDRWKKTGVQSGAGDEPLRFNLHSLQSGTQYEYRLRCREGREAPPSPFKVKDDRPFGVRAVHTFKTLAKKEKPFRFVFMTDSHIFRWWEASVLGIDNTSVKTFSSSIRNVEELGPDFIILGGDEFLTHCNQCRGTFVDGEFTGERTISSVREGELRYRQGMRMFSPLAAEFPLFLTLGNHEGEAGFGNEGGKCNHFSNTKALSEQARLKYLPNPSEVYGGGEEGGYYSFEHAGALFVVLDVMRYVSEYPSSPEDWTLGSEQLAWLEKTLKESNAKWKFIFLHHLVGGYASRDGCYSYGRGGIRATDTGRRDGRFLGEQARLHDLFVRYGVQAVFFGHDHVFVSGEKDGVLYVLGGHPSGNAPPSWERKKVFREQYDYNEDGFPDYLIENGVVSVDVQGDSAVIRYIESNGEDASLNGRVLFEKTIFS